MHTREPTRRSFLGSLAGVTASFAAGGSLRSSPSAADSGGEAKTRPPVIDTHMHVWADDPERYPFPHPYEPDFKAPAVPGTVEMLIEDMDANGVTHCVLVQVIFHGWDNTYVADCVRRYPKRLKAHGLIDPTAPDVAEKLEYWVRERGLSGMRFSPIYYKGRDDWLNASSTRTVWRKAEELRAVFNFFISTEQLPRLEDMVQRFPGVSVIVDHLSQIDLGVEDPLPAMKKLLALARYPNVWVKVSELTSVSKSGTYPFADAYPWVRRVQEAFGPDRLLWGTGYPGAARAHYKRPTLAKEIALVREEMSFLPKQDREKILGRNAAALWRFE